MTADVTRSPDVLPVDCMAYVRLLIRDFLEIYCGNSWWTLSSLFMKVTVKIPGDGSDDRYLIVLLGSQWVEIGSWNSNFVFLLISKRDLYFISILDFTNLIHCHYSLHHPS